MFNLIKVAHAQERWEEVQRLANRVLEINPEHRLAPIILREAVRNQRKAEAKKMQDKIQTIQEEYLDSEKPTAIIGMDEISFEERGHVGNQRISELRQQLYRGEIAADKIQQLSEELKDSLEGRLFIAEMCTYFQQAKLALQALKGYQKEHQEDMTELERKVLTKALEIAKSKQRIKNGDKWDSIYTKNEDEKGIEK